MDVLELPFIVTNAEAGSRTAWALYQKFPEIQALFNDVKLLSIWTTDPYAIASKKPIKKLEDLKGMKIRCAGKPQTDMMKLLGGTPIYIPMPGVYINLQKGVLDGNCTPGEALIGFRFYEIDKHINFANTPANLHFLVMNKKIWNDMPSDIQEAIMSVSGEYAGVNFYGGGTFDKIAKEAPGIIKKAGYEIDYYTPPKEEMDRWIEIGGKPLWDAWLKENESKGPAKEIFDETRRLMKQFTEN
jgi:TRAP-type C4-dicarboxylate transport system substrate-binding protein